MQSENRLVNVSLDNIKASVETFLRTMGSIGDKELVTLTFGDETAGQGLKDKKWQDMTVVPVHIRLEEGVTFTKINGHEKET